FPNDGKEQLIYMYREVTPKIAKPFLGSYTNTLDTMRIYFKNKILIAHYTKFSDHTPLKIRDSKSLNLSGAYLKFNDDASEFYFLMEAQKPYFKRIPINDKTLPQHP
ncbi:MAG: hypothetical protein ACJA1B_001473, partial [Polaribacter sp.]